MDETIEAILGNVVRFEWVADRLELAGIQPRHLGRPVTFEYYASTTDAANYESDRCVGTLDGVEGSSVLVSGQDFDYARMGGLKVWRKQVKR